MIDPSTAIAAASAVVAGLSFAGGAFYFGGRIARSIEVLNTTVGDHEHRLRRLERPPQR